MTMYHFHPDGTTSITHELNTPDKYLEEGYWQYDANLAEFQRWWTFPIGRRFSEGLINYQENRVPNEIKVKLLLLRN